MNRAQRRQALKRLHAEMLACRKCLEAGHPILPGAIFSGGLGARVMVIGQAPGITEHQAGRPFNATSGTRLFRWLAEAGLDEVDYRSHEYLTAVTKCYPGKARGGGDRVPSAEEQALCRPLLERELALIQPELVIPVGRLAIGLFYPRNPALSQVIGTEKSEGGRWIVPLPHPSGASRWHQTPENQARIGEAIRLIRRRRPR